MSKFGAGFLLGLTLVFSGVLHADEDDKTVGVLFVAHGGSEESSLGGTFDNSVQFFQYDPNNVVYNMVTWNPRA